MSWKCWFKGHDWKMEATCCQEQYIIPDGMTKYTIFLYKCTKCLGIRTTKVLGDFFLLEKKINPDDFYDYLEKKFKPH